MNPIMNNSEKQPIEHQVINLGKDLYQIVQKALFIAGCFFSLLIIVLGLTVSNEAIPTIEGIPHVVVRISMIFTLAFFLQFPWVIVALVRKYIRDKAKSEKTGESKQQGQ